MYTALPPIFAGQPPDVAAEAQAFLAHATFEAGDVIMLEGEDDHSLAFVLSGTVELNANGVVLGHAGAREIVGETELFALCPRLATVTATTACELLVLDDNGYQELLASGNPVVYALERQVIKRLGERIRAVNNAVAEQSQGQEKVVTSTQKSMMERLFSPFQRPPPEIEVEPLPVLRSSEMFGWAPEDALRDIAGIFRSASFQAHDPICRQGEAGDRMFIIETGQVDVTLDIKGTRIEKVAQLGPGQAFGDSSIALGTPRAASCIARTAVTAISMERSKFLEFYGLDAPVGSIFRQAIVRNLIVQLMASTDKLLQLHAGREMAGSSDLGRSIWRD